MDSYCKKFVEDIFLEHDYDRSNVLEKRKLKNWARDELKRATAYSKRRCSRNHSTASSEKVYVKLSAGNSLSTVSEQLP